MFHKGQKVVCISADPNFNNEWAEPGTFGTDMDGLTKGTIYTVRHVEGDSMWLEEIRRSARVASPTKTWTDDGPYWADRFRPLKKTSIEIFEAILKKASAPSEQKVE